jgi:hypothetical protein
MVRFIDLMAKDVKEGGPSLKADGVGLNLFVSAVARNC